MLIGEDGTTPLAGTLTGGYTLPTLNVPANNHELHFAAGSNSSEPLDGKVGLYLDPTGMDIPALTAYYMARIPDGSPAEFLAYRAYLISALDGVTKPFAYITTDGSNNLVLHDAAQYDLEGDLAVGMVIPDDYPLRHLHREWLRQGHSWKCHPGDFETDRLRRPRCTHADRHRRHGWCHAAGL